MEAVCCSTAEPHGCKPQPCCFVYAFVVLYYFLPCLLCFARPHFWFRPSLKCPSLLFTHFFVIHPPFFAPPRVKCKACRRRNRRSGHHFRSYRTSARGSPGHRRRSERFHQPAGQDSPVSREFGAGRASCSSQHSPSSRSTPGQPRTGAGWSTPTRTCSIFM